jgi:uridine phosphorylase
MEKIIPDSELIINPDGSIYHLQLRPDQVADTIITVGDPDRVAEVSRHFDSIQHRAQHREFVTHTGMLGARQITVVSTGIGTDNIDIVFNELDALVNIDFATRTIKKEIRSLDIIRLGTSGAVSEEVELESILLSSAGIGLDSLMAYYRQDHHRSERELQDAFEKHIADILPHVRPYVAMGDESLLSKFGSMGQRGITVTAPGFYAPQGRCLRSANQTNDLVSLFHSFRHADMRITNLEMETAGIYALGKHLGHRCLSVNAILAHRIKNTFSTNPALVVDKMIKNALEILSR